MILKVEELTWVSDKLNTYEIKYQEIYDELKDHILTAIEVLREQGDARDIELLFTEVVKKQFPGYWPFEDIVKEYASAYRQRVRKTMWANYKHYFNWQTVPLMVILLWASFYLPHVKKVIAPMMIMLLMISIVPIVYVYYRGRRIHTDNGKHSYVKGYLLTVSNLLLILFNLGFNTIGILFKDSFLSPRNYPPYVCMLLLIASFVYCLSCIRLSRQEFKIAA
jgi:hypothetical protein